MLENSYIVDSKRQLFRGLLKLSKDLKKAHVVFITNYSLPLEYYNYDKLLGLQEYIVHYDIKDLDDETSSNFARKLYRNDINKEHLKILGGRASDIKHYINFLRENPNDAWERLTSEKIVAIKKVHERYQGWFNNDYLKIMNALSQSQSKSLPLEELIIKSGVSRQSIDKILDDQSMMLFSVKRNGQVEIVAPSPLHQYLFQTMYLKN